MLTPSPIPNKSGWGKRKRASGTGPNARKKHAERSFRGERTWQSFPARKSPGMGCGFFLFRGPSITHVEWCRTKQPGQLPKPSLHNQRNNTIIHLILKMGLEPPELHRRALGSDDCIRGKAVRQGHSVPCLYQHLLACEGVAPPLYLAGRVQCPRRASRMAYCNFTDVRFATASVQLQPLATGPIEAKFLASTQADGDLSGVDERHN